MYTSCICIGGVCSSATTVSPPSQQKSHQSQASTSQDHRHDNNHQLSACYHKMTSRIITVINVIITLSPITTVIDIIGRYYAAWKMTSGSLIIINVILLSPNTNFPSFLQDNELVTARNDQFGDTCESLSMSSSNTPKVILKLSYFAERHVELFAFDLLTM